MANMEKAKKELGDWLHDLWCMYFEGCGENHSPPFYLIKQYIEQYGYGDIGWTACGALEYLQEHPGLMTAYMQDLESDEQRELLIYFVLANCGVATSQKLYQSLKKDHGFVREKTNAFDILLKDKDMLELLAHESIPIERREKLTIEEAFCQAMAYAATEHEKIRSLKMFMDLFRLFDWWGHRDEDLVSIGYWDENFVTIPLFESIWRGDFGMAVMHYFFGEYFGDCSARWDKESPIETFSLGPPNTVGMDHPQVAALSMMLSDLTDLYLHPNSWTREGALCFLRAIKRNKSITMLELSMPEEIFKDDENNSVEEAIQEFLTMNNTLETLDIQSFGIEQRIDGESFRRFDSTPDDCFLMAFLRSLTPVKTSSVKTLCLSELILVEPRHLAKYLANCEQSGLKMNQVEFLESDVQWRFQRTCQLKSVQISFVAREDHDLTCCKDLIHQLGVLPLLEDLDLECRGNRDSGDVPQDFTEALSDATRQGNLRRFCISHMNVRVEAFNEILQNNTQLEELDILALNHHIGTTEATLACVARNLEHNNFRLTKINKSCQCRDEKKLDYYTTLNRFGRAQVLSQTITRPEFVDLLCKCHAGPKILFGLLRAAPHVWSDI